MIKDFFEGINFRREVIKAVIAALVAIPLVAIVGKISKNNWAGLYHSYEVKFEVSLAKLLGLFVLVSLLLFIAGVLAAKFRRLTILSAQYGVKDKYTDIAPELNNFIANNQLTIRLSNGVTGGFDPAPGIYKHAIINYMCGRKKKKITVNEGDRINLPSKK